MTLDVKKVAKQVAAVANTATITVAALQSSGMLAALSPTANAIILGVLGVLNAVVHALPATVLTPDAAK